MDEVDEVDVALLDALHRNPRASFAQLGAAIDLSAVTVARRWRRLADAGLAWVSSVPGPRLALVAAVYEVEASPGRTEQVGRALGEIPQVASVYLTDGVFDLHSLVFATDMDALSELVIDRLPQVPGTVRSRVHVGLDWFSGVRWSLGALNEEQEQSVAGEDPRRGRNVALGDGRALVLGDADRALFLALQPDGRAGYRDLARELGTSEYAVRRQLTSLQRRGGIAFRTDFARGTGGWPVEFVLWLTVPPEWLARVGADIGAWSETRICMSTVGVANLLVMAQVHRLADIGALLTRVREAFPDVAVADQRVVLRPLKSWGRVLDRRGPAVGVVPVDLWAPVSCDPPA